MRKRKKGRKAYKKKGKRNAQRSRRRQRRKRKKGEKQEGRRRERGTHMGREEEMRRKTLNEERDGEKQRVRRERGTYKEEEDVRGGKGKREKKKQRIRTKDAMNCGRSYVTLRTARYMSISCSSLARESTSCSASVSPQPLTPSLGWAERGLKSGCFGRGFHVEKEGLPFGKGEVLILKRERFLF